jgi:hypothetical protein
MGYPNAIEIRDDMRDDRGEPIIKLGPTREVISVLFRHPERIEIEGLNFGPEQPPYDSLPQLHRTDPAL